MTGRAPRCGNCGRTFDHCSGECIPVAHLSLPYRCSTCGIVRTSSEGAPWCRHNDLDFKIPASRMVLMPAAWWAMVKDES